MAIDITHRTFQSGLKLTSFAEIGAAAGEQQIQSKDDTTASQFFQIFAVWLACATGGNIALFDGSATANPFLRLYAGGDVTIGTLQQSWDFRDDPLDLTSQDATSLCISTTGTFQGQIKWGWTSKVGS